MRFGRNLFNDYLTNYRIKAAKVELHNYLKNDPPNNQKIFEKLGEILDHPDDNSIEVYTMCLEKFPDDKDIKRL